MGWAGVETTTLWPEPPERGHPVLIVGASARAAAFGLRRAGWTPWTIDLFADADTRVLTRGRSRRIASRRYPCHLPNLARGWVPSDAAWLAVGGLENHPNVLEQIKACVTGPALGCSPEATRAVRDWRKLGPFLIRHHFAAPETRLDHAGVPCDGSWLLKPRASAGGRRVEPWRGQRLDNPSDWLWQQRIVGVAVSAVYRVGSSHDCQLVGITRQFHGLPGRPFLHRGNLAPWYPPLPTLHPELEGLGQRLTETFGLAGLFGVDGVLDSKGRFQVVEVNPRPPASAELFERGASRQTPALKWVAYAPRPLQLPDPPPLWWRDALERAVCLDPAPPTFADLPLPGTRFQTGDPFCSFLVPCEPNDNPASIDRALQPLDDLFNSLPSLDS